MLRITGAQFTLLLRSMRRTLLPRLLSGTTVKTVLSTPRLASATALMERKNAKMKKAWNIIKNILVWLILIAAIGMMIFTIFSVNTFDQSHRSIFGYKFFIVQSDSMSATDFDAGDIIFVKEVDPATLQEGDIIRAGRN